MQKVTITKTVEKFNTSNKKGNLEETKDSSELEINQDESLIPPWFR